ncbi:MAG TPA: hypothetical protein VF131_04380 [Blastocatellia bacterium]|nr:hypothetical protein [Blastocatellia bacterium]
MKRKVKIEEEDELRPEYDLSKLKGGVRGKYAQRYKEGTNLVLLEPDVAEAFPDDESVNRALRLLMEISERQLTHSRR